MTRKQASTIMQLRTGHIALNFYLRRILVGKVATENCTKCEEGPNLNIVHAKETINHFLFECQAYDDERHDLVAKIGRSHLSIRESGKVWYNVV
jgi:hypothetical protein